MPKNKGAPQQVSAEDLTLQLSTALADISATLDTAEKQLLHLRSLRTMLNVSVSDSEQRMSSILNQNQQGTAMAPPMLGRR